MTRIFSIGAVLFANRLAESLAVSMRPMLRTAARTKTLLLEVVAEGESLGGQSLLQAGTTLQHWGAEHDLQAGLTAIPAEPAMLQVSSTLQGWGAPLSLQGELPIVNLKPVFSSLQHWGDPHVSMVEVSSSGAQVLQDASSEIGSTLQGFGAQVASQQQVPSEPMLLQSRVSLDHWGDRWHHGPDEISAAPSLLQTAEDQPEAETDSIGDWKEPPSLAQLLAPRVSRNDVAWALWGMPFPSMRRVTHLAPHHIGLLFMILCAFALALIPGVKTTVSSAAAASTSRLYCRASASAVYTLQQCTDRGS